jgi:hypothetical protein
MVDAKGMAALKYVNNLDEATLDEIILTEECG